MGVTAASCSRSLRQRLQAAATGSGYRQRLFDRINIGMSIRRI